MMDSLRWWPSSRCWQWKGKIYYGKHDALKGFVKNRESEL